MVKGFNGKETRLMPKKRKSKAHNGWRGPTTYEKWIKLKYAHLESSHKQKN